MMTEKEVYLYDMLIELNIATEKELNLAFNITDMCWLDTLNRVLYARTGYRSLEQYLEEEGEEIAGARFFRAFFQSYMRIDQHPHIRNFFYCRTPATVACGICESSTGSNICQVKNYTKLHKNKSRFLCNITHCIFLLPML